MKEIISLLLVFIFPFTVSACRKMPTDDFDDFIKPDYSESSVSNQSPLVTYSLPDGTEITVNEGTDITEYTMQKAAVSCERKYEKIENEILDLINKERKKAGIKPLLFYKDAYCFVKARADECFEHFEHKRPSGTNWDTVYTEANVLLNGVWGENLAKGESVPKEEIAAADVERWMNSKGHRENILNPDFKKVCISIIIKEDRHISVQHFFG